VEEVLRALVGAGDIFLHAGTWDRKPIAELRVPRSVDDAVQRRTVVLSDAARKVVEVAAVAGRRFHFDLLAELTELDEHTLVGIVKELIGAGLMVEEADDQLAFRHALTRQAIYTGLLTRERRALHRQVAGALERVSTSRADESAADLAFHYAEAHQWQAALPYARQAGERALRMYAPRAAVEQLTRAIDAARALSVTPEPEVFRLRGEAYELLGDFDAARGDLETAISSAQAAGDQRVEWQALLDLSLLWAGRNYEHTGAYADQALELARAINDPSLIAQTMNRIGNWHMNRDNLPESLRYHQEALRLFEQLGDERGRAETLDLLGMASSSMSGRSAAYYAEAIPLLRRLDDRPRLVTSLMMRMLANGAYLYETSPVGNVAEDEALALGDEALRIARDMNWPAGESFARWELALWLAPRGEYTRALRSAQAGLELATEIGHRQWISAARATLGLIHWDIFAFDIADSLLMAALAVAREIGSRNFVHLALAGLASVYLGQRRFADATSMLDEALGGGAPPETAGLRFCWMVRAELALAHNDAASALAISDRLNETTEPGVAARVWHARGDALAQLGRGSEAVEVLEQARATARTHSARGRLWRVELSLARALRSVGRREDAERVVASVRTTLEALAAAIEDDQLRDGFERATARLIPAAATVSAARAAKQRFGGLTTRERQVARLIASGLSNRAIADQLILGERTVESYVANILSKLGFNARTQIAAWVVETGLAEAHD
jgi:DNA-binding CsgD family transcriptional regulator/predicted negative regulator of RcsB-dependent stress response